jgi:hypothetical protein
MQTTVVLVLLAILVVANAAPTPSKLLTSSFSGTVAIVYHGQVIQNLTVYSDSKLQATLTDTVDIAAGFPVHNLLWYKPNNKVQLISIGNDPVTCNNISLNQPNIFEMDLFSNATYGGVTAVNGHIVNRWDYAYFYDKSMPTTMYFDVFTGYPVRVAYPVGGADRTWDYSNFVPGTPDQDHFKVPSEIKCNSQGKIANPFYYKFL